MGFKEFKEKVIGDKAFAEKFKGLSTPEEIVKVAATAGFSFTVDDLRNNAELTDAELDAVAGGRWGGGPFIGTYFVM